MTDGRASFTGSSCLGPNNSLSSKPPFGSVAGDELATIWRRIDALEEQLVALHRANEVSPRLAKLLPAVAEKHMSPCQ
jgi:hypothetical protein